jgi:AcrR family transcriptional regulator
VTDAPTRRGRPRSADVDERIRRATLELLERDGYARMSMDAVAEEAGVGKTTIYRRYKDKADLVTGAIAAFGDDHVLPDSGDLFEDLVELLHQFEGRKERQSTWGINGTLFLERDRAPELLDLFRERVITPRRQIGIDLLERGKQRGEVRADLDSELAIEMMVGSWFALQLNGRTFEGDWARSVARQIWPALIP